VPGHILSNPSKVKANGKFALDLGLYADEVTAFCVWLLDEISKTKGTTLFACDNVLSMKVWACTPIV